MPRPNSTQSHIAQDEQVDRIRARFPRGEHVPDSVLELYQDDGELLCGDCGGPSKTHTGDKRQQVFIGECCQQPETSALPANYAEQQIAILEDVVGLVESHAALLDQSLAHLRWVRMQSTDRLMMHVEIAERLLRRLKGAA